MSFWKKNKRIEDHSVIDKNNTIGNLTKYLKMSNKNQYPIVYVDSKPLWIGDSLYRKNIYTTLDNLHRFDVLSAGNNGFSFEIVDDKKTFTEWIKSSEKQKINPSKKSKFRCISCGDIDENRKSTMDSTLCDSCWTSISCSFSFVSP